MPAAGRTLAPDAGVLPQPAIDRAATSPTMPAAAVLFARIALIPRRLLYLLMT
jgi:hypothetical protein